jgi:hypothetical protein
MAKNNLPSRFTKAKTIDPSVYSANSLILRKDLVRFLATRTKGNLDLDTVLKRINKRLTYGVNEGVLEAPVEGRFIFGSAVYWASQQWPNVFDDCPVIFPGNFCSISVTLPLPTVKATAISLPTDAESCHDEMRGMQKLYLDQSETLAKLQTELELLRPSAEKYEQIRLNNSISGKRGGRGRML